MIVTLLFLCTPSCTLFLVLFYISLIPLSLLPVVHSSFFTTRFFTSVFLFHLLMISPLPFLRFTFFSKLIIRHLNSFSSCHNFHLYSSVQPFISMSFVLLLNFSSLSLCHSNGPSVYHFALESHATIIHPPSPTLLLCITITPLYTSLIKIPFTTIKQPPLPTFTSSPLAYYSPQSPSLC